MFKWLNKQGVESDEGFVVQFTGRFTLDYIEDGQAIEVTFASSTHGGLPSIHVARTCFATAASRASALRVHAPDHEDHARELENLRRALDFQGLKLIVEQ
jgi:hypothetical protein